MNLSLQDLKNAAANLSIAERADLAQFLLRSLDRPDVDEVRTAWLALAEQRMAEVHAGKVVGIPAEKVVKNLI